ncbi:MAG: GTPase Era [Candidatus Omnitrophica bacterium]|nr:GTPase Era [Candidatus Omnitrophota bacterium]
MKEEFKCGFVAILGRPNVGKSTVLNALVGNKISIVSPIPQTTRHQIRGILNVEGAQIVFLDTPGVHSFKDSLAKHLNTIAARSLDGCDLIIYVADVSRRVGDEEKRIIDILLRQETKVVMALNKMDLGSRYLNDYIDFWKTHIEAKKGKDFLIVYMPLSAKTGKNIDTLRDIIVDNLPVHPPFYDPESKTDFPIKFRIADVVREKLFLQLKRELPHSIAVEVGEMAERQTTQGQKITDIAVTIYVNRSSQRKIIIGKNGEGLKEAGKQARLDLEEILGNKVFLKLWVKVLEDWQQKPRILKELGYWWM